ncbi:MAG: RNA-binding protein [Rhodobacterales bacterium]|nr:RNA-binding protein [Rhodobacterales bacterium]
MVRETHATQDGEAAESVRRCLVTGERRPKAALVRCVVDPAGRVVPDVAARLPGRGLWLCASRDVVNTACARNLFSRAARARVEVPADLADTIERLLLNRCLDLLGLARRAGQVVAGFEKVKAALRNSAPGVLLAAGDGAPGGRDKVRALAPQATLLDHFSGAELGSALGRDHTVHAVVAPGRLAEALILEAGRLAGFRPPARDAWTGDVRTGEAGTGDAPSHADRAMENATGYVTD